MKLAMTTLLLVFWNTLLVGQTEAELARIPLDDYMVGTTYNYPDQIRRAFSDSAQLHLDRDGEDWLVSPEAYAQLFSRRPAGSKNGRQSTLLTLDIRQNTATAEIEVIIPSLEARFIDLLLLKKLDGAWKIVSKTATRYPRSPPYNGPEKKVVLEGLKHPWSMDFLSETDVLIAEKDGQLLRCNLMTKERMPIQGFPADLFTTLLLNNSKYPAGTYPAVSDGKAVRWNAGILEVVLDPNFTQNQWVYLSYVSEQLDQYALKVIRATLERGQLTNIQTLLNPGPYVPGLFHFGGGMTFGPDGKLYVTVGERLYSEHLKEGIAIAQDVTDARGKIYRINPDGSIPLDNPDFGPEAVPGIYATGIRAAQGITVRPGTQQIWFSEHGTRQGDELNLLQAGANYGWPNVTTGGYRSEGYQAADVPGAVFTDPIHFWVQTVAPTGLVFYTGNEFPEWQGNLIVPGLSRGSLWRLTLDGDTVRSVEELFTDDHIRLRKAKMSPGGKLYLLTDEADGKLIEVIR